MFPTLTRGADRADRAPRAGAAFAVGEILWEQGEMNRPLLVVLAGEIEVLSDAGSTRHVHRARQLLRRRRHASPIGRPSTRARARVAGRVLEVPAERVRALVQTDPELSEIFLRAFILRRTLI